jgi:hypothetical protein
VSAAVVVVIFLAPARTLATPVYAAYLAAAVACAETVLAAVPKMEISRGRAEGPKDRLAA